ncbi:glycosyltransferase family 39 protein [Spongiibacter sp. KMU-158]|uniref:Glycosyltransferase family 39 protein n=1 Tax=Spongiibacter pelagi TaxID=2760804 RepID=A0A927BZN7_9GAMM|nr:glycosyltransferase family 39 protein [Spongiibacter pelagi]MBD2858540.1 glycosyltransferase family 39 protein [Spongiibacter pelagi]
MSAATRLSGLPFIGAAWPLLFLFCGFLFNLSGAPLFDLDEGAFSEASREILETNVWSATYLNGEPRYDKPILTYWLQASSMAVFGLNEISMRLHSVLAAMCWGLAIFLFCREFCDRKTATAALLIFSSTLLVTVIGRAATADALLNLFIALSFLDIYRYSQSQSRKHLLRSWLWISLGMLTKGPVAAGIPLIASGLWFASEKNLREWRRAIFHPLGWLILIAILLPWLLAIWQEQGSGFFKGFLLDHNLGRFTNTKEGHGGQWYYYIVLLPIALLPYSGMLLSLLGHWRSLWRKPLERLLLIWFGLVFILVSLSQTQLPHYVLYGITPLLILFAKYRHSFARHNWQLLLPVLFFALQIGLWFFSQNAAETEKISICRHC